MNSRPAWPASVKIGRKLTVMSSSEKKIGRPTSLHASTMTRWRSRPGGAAASRTCAFSISTIDRVGQLADGDGDAAERHDVRRQAEVPDRR